jgi:hypothetical protein
VRVSRDGSSNECIMGATGVPQAYSPVLASSSTVFAIDAGVPLIAASTHCRCRFESMGAISLIVREMGWTLALPSPTPLMSGAVPTFSMESEGLVSDPGAA